MSKSSTLDTLIELATDEAGKAAVQLGHSIRHATDAEQKLTMLVQYRDEYDARFQQNLKIGLSAGDYRNYQHFIDKLDQAIADQQQIVQMARNRIDQDRSSWQSSEKKRASFDTLATRAQKAAQKKESRIEQKEMDEYAMRKQHYKQ